jgi:hypothetical protein
MLRRLITRIRALPARLSGRWQTVKQRHGYAATHAALAIPGAVLCAWHRLVPGNKGVLHVSYMVHVPHYTVGLLREYGLKADYLAVGRSSHWSQSDYVYEAPTDPVRRAVHEWKWLWFVLARYRIIHSHFMIGITQDGWELPWLKRAGVKLLVHFRGCEARDRAQNMQNHPEVNICQGCEYNPRICEMPVNHLRQGLARQHADKTLVTTRDMLEFVPEATWFPFFAPIDAALPDRRRAAWPQSPMLRLVHVTSHPGLEGRPLIAEAVEKARAQGAPVEFHPVTGVTHAEALQELADADVAIGKMTMGDYANAQIESMALGVPTITWVRPEFRTPDLEASGFFLCHVNELAGLLLRLTQDPDLLATKRHIARSSVLKLHENKALVARLAEYYRDMLGGRLP